VATAEELDTSTGTLTSLQRYFGSRIAAVAYLLFILIYAPCVSAVAAIYRETNWKWALFAVVYLTGLAWTVAVLFYQAATFHEHPASSGAWITGIAAAGILFYNGLKLTARLRPVAE
jgi:ferrous iron transport protein B